MYRGILKWEIWEEKTNRYATCWEQCCQPSWYYPSWDSQGWIPGCSKSLGFHRHIPSSCWVYWSGRELRTGGPTFPLQKALISSSVQSCPALTRMQAQISSPIRESFTPTTWLGQMDGVTPGDFPLLPQGKCAGPQHEPISQDAGVVAWGCVKAV